MSGVRGDARKRQQGEHLTHHDAGVRAIIEREVAKERERIAQAIEARLTPRDDMYEWHIYINDGLRDAARIARKAGQS